MLGGVLLPVGAHGGLDGPGTLVPAAALLSRQGGGQDGLPGGLGGGPLPLARAAGLGLLGPGGRGLLLGRALPAPALGLGPGRGAPPAAC